MSLWRKRQEPKQEQDEPVAYRYKMGVGDDYWVWNYCAYPDNKDDPRCEPLYTTPQPRTWVDLTDDEVEMIEESKRAATWKFILEVESYLKRKHT